MVHPSAFFMLWMSRLFVIILWVYQLSSSAISLCFGHLGKSNLWKLKSTMPPSNDRAYVFSGPSFSWHTKCQTEPFYSTSFLSERGCVLFSIYMYVQLDSRSLPSRHVQPKLDIFVVSWWNTLPLSKSLDLVRRCLQLFRFKDNNIIDKDVYHYNKTLEISDVNGLKGAYRCRVVNDYGSEFSDVADLQVFSECKLVGNNDVPCEHWVGFSYAKRERNHCEQPFVPLS